MGIFPARVEVVSLWNLDLDALTDCSQAACEALIQASLQAFVLRQISIDLLDLNVHAAINHTTHQLGLFPTNI